MNKKLFIICAILLSLSIGFLLACCILKWFEIKAFFFHITITDILEIFVTIIIVAIVTNILSNKINMALRKRDFILEIFNKFQNELIEIFTFGTKYMNEPIKDIEKKIVSKFKDASISLNLIHDILDSKNIKCKRFTYEIFRSDFSCLKVTLTDSPFGEKDAKYSKEKIDKFEKLYKKIIKNLFECKIDLYS